MNRVNLQSAGVDELVEQFAAIAVAQDDAMREGALGDNAKYNKLCLRMRDVEEELKNRTGDQRRALLTLYEHPNMQVRLMAAKLTLAIAPEAGRRMLQMIADSHRQPQAGDAGMCLWNLDRGVFVPK